MVERAPREQEFADRLIAQGLDLEQVHQANAALRLLIDSLGLDTSHSQAIGDYAAALVEASAHTTQSDDTGNLAGVEQGATDERERLIDDLVTSDDVFAMVDYYGRLPGGGFTEGHGIKGSKGSPPSGGTIADLDQPGRWEKEHLFAGEDYWHRGKAAVGRIEDDAYTTFVLSFQGRRMKLDSRPAVRLYIAMPRSADYAAVADAISGDPSMLMDVFPRLGGSLGIPDPERMLEGVELKTDEVPTWKLAPKPGR